MPIPILVAVGATVVGALGSGAGVAAYKNNKHNKAEASWQEERRRLQQKILDHQGQLRKREERILEMQKRLTQKTRELEEITQNLYEVDRMIELLEKRHRKLESFVYKLIALLTLRCGKLKEQTVDTRKEIDQESTKKQELSDKYDAESMNKNELENKIQSASNKNTFLEQAIIELQQEVSQLEDEDNYETV